MRPFWHSWHQPPRHALYFSHLWMVGWIVDGVSINSRFLRISHSRILASEEQKQDENKNGINESNWTRRQPLNHFVYNCTAAGQFILNTMAKVFCSSLVLSHRFILYNEICLLAIGLGDCVHLATAREMKLITIIKAADTVMERS